MYKSLKNWKYTLIIICKNNIDLGLIKSLHFLNFGKIRKMKIRKKNFETYLGMKFKILNKENT